MSDLFTKAAKCASCGGAFTVWAEIHENVWTAIKPEVIASQHDACPTCLFRWLGEKYGYPTMRIACLADDEIVDAEARGRRSGWLSACRRVEEAAGAFPPMDTLIDMMKSAGGAVTPLAELFDGYKIEFEKRVLSLREGAPTGGLEDQIVIGDN